MTITETGLGEQVSTQRADSDQPAPTLTYRSTQEAPADSTPCPSEATIAQSMSVLAGKRTQTLTTSEPSPSKFVRREEEWGIKGLREWVIVAFKHRRQKSKMIKKYEYKPKRSIFPSRTRS